jgi:two-component system phosphate regulon sensor histidine kinase PhoR
MMAKAKPHKPFEIETVFLAIAGHHPRQPFQVIKNAYEFLDRGVRTASDSAIDRLRDQLDELVAALQLRESAKGVKLTPVRVSPLLEQAAYENEFAAQTKGLSVRTAPTSDTIESDALLLGTILRNLISNAVKCTQAAFSSVAVTSTMRHTTLMIRQLPSGLDFEILPRRQRAGAWSTLGCKR